MTLFMTIFQLSIGYIFKLAVSQVVCSSGSLCVINSETSKNKQICLIDISSSRLGFCEIDYLS